MSKKVILGGTFDHVHIGHEKLLRTALKEGEVTVGLVSDEMLEEWKPEVERAYEERKKNLENFLSNFDQGWNIVPIDDPYSEAVEGDYDLLVVSYETEKRGNKLNEKRKELGKQPLEMKVVKPVVGEDLLPVNSSRIREGEINEAGERLTPVKVRVGSKNEVKINTVKEELSDLFEVEVTSVRPEGISEQPFDEEIIYNARKRAEMEEGFDYGVGIESGIIDTKKGTFSVEYTVIKDKYGYESKGHGPGFPVPKDWTDDLRKSITLKDKMSIYFDGYSDDLGSIGLLTDGEIKREECIRASFLTAMIPRLNSEIYFKDEGF